MSDAPLAPADRLFWEISARYPTRPMVCALYLELAGAPDRSRLERRLAALVAAHPRLASTLVVGRGGPRWRLAAAPSLDASIDGASDHADRLAHLAPGLGAPLPEGGPAWSIELHADRAARVHGLALRWHHALTDAEGMLELLTALTDRAAGIDRDDHRSGASEGDDDVAATEDDDDVASTGGDDDVASSEGDDDVAATEDDDGASTGGDDDVASSEGDDDVALSERDDELDRGDRLADADPRDDHRAAERLDPHARGDEKPTIAGITPPGALTRLRRALARLRGAAHPDPNVGGARVDYRAIDRRIDARRLRGLARRLGVTPHDLFVAIVARALHRLGLADGGPTIVHSPISARPRDGRIRPGNLGYPLHVVVDRDEPDLEAALRSIGAANAAALASAAAPPAALLGLVPRLPRRAFERALARAPRFVANYLPWSDAPRSLAGAAITAVHGFAPLLPFRGCTIVAAGYRDALRLTLATDPTIHGDADAILRALTAEVDALVALAP